MGEDGGLIAGHARVLAARQLGIAEIPVMVAAGWSEAQKRAYVLAMHRGGGGPLYEFETEREVAEFVGSRMIQPRW